MTQHESRILARSIGVGVIITFVVIVALALGWLTSLEDYLYDQRAAVCQFMTPPPTKQIVHLDIDDRALAYIGRWPWPRATLARILDEVRLAEPSAVGLDILFSEPQEPRILQNADGSYRKIDDDAELVDVLQKLGNAVLATSFSLEPTDTSRTALSSAVEWFNDHLELTPEEFDRKIHASEWKNLNLASIDDLYLHARRLAMLAQIDRELDKGSVSPDELRKRLLPHADPDPNFKSPLIRLLDEEYAVSSAVHAVARFGGAIPLLPITPLHGTLSILPTANYTDAAAGCGFANYDIFGSATVRSVPLIVEFNHKLYPQMGLAVACVMLGADPKSVRFESSNVIIPYPGGKISIPTYTYHSKALGIDVPMIAAVPWFGGRNWETMYDWPGHQSVVGHISVDKVWQICTTRDEIVRNNASIDSAISHILDNDREDKLSLDPPLAKKYAATTREAQDTDSREKMAATTLADLKDSGWLDAYRQMSDRDMKPVERFQRDELFEANSVLHSAVDQNHQLRGQLIALRRDLADQIGSKGVLVGYVATGFQDKVKTSLHDHAPGVVVHGVIANAVLLNRWWRFAPTWVGVLLTLLLGLTTAVIQGRYSPIKASLLALGLAVGYSVINGLVLFGWQRWIVSLAGPIVAITAVWAACTLFGVITEGLERIRVSAEKDILHKEMSLARKVQFALIPKEPPEMEGINADGWTLPADLTGGDCFDLWKLPDGRLGVLVADASGHGLAPAMIVSQVRTLVKMMSEYGMHPHELLRRINGRLALDLEPGRFVTAFVAFINTGGQIDWASAGHGPILWCPTGDGEMIHLTSSGLPLGVQEDWLADDPSPPLEMQPTGRLIVLSDGIFEAVSPEQELWGTDPVVAILHKMCNASSRELIESIRTGAQAWQKKSEPADDQTIVVVRRLPVAQQTVTAPAGDPASPGAPAVEVTVAAPPIRLRAAISDSDQHSVPEEIKE